MATSGERLLFVEFDSKGRLWNVATDKPHGGGNYDVEFSRRDGYLVRSGGSAGIAVGDYVDGKIAVWWAAEGFEPQKLGGQQCRLRRLPRRIKEEILDIVYYGECNDPVYCSICDDWYDGDTYPQPCKHVWWCHGDGEIDGCAQWTGPGSEDPCYHGGGTFDVISKANRSEIVPDDDSYSIAFRPRYSGRAT
jgi:hypothetical protein